MAFGNMRSSYDPLRAVRYGLNLLLLCAYGAVMAQVPRSTVERALAAADDSSKVQALCDLCFAYRRIDADSAMVFGDRALQLARRISSRKGEAQALNDLSILYMDRSAYHTADSLLRQALAIRTALGDEAGIGAIHNKLGNSFQSRFMLEEALEENFKALAIYERIGPPAYEALVLNNIAILQFNLRRLEAALRTHERAAALRERIGDGPGLAASQGNMANVLLQLGDTMAAVGLYERAIVFFRGKELRAELAVQLHNLAGVRRGQGQLAVAERLFEEALRIRRALAEPKAVASSIIGLGGVLLQRGDVAGARPLLIEGLALSTALGVRSERMQALRDMAALHAEARRSDSTLWYYRQYTALRDSVFDDDLNARMAQLEARYETVRKEREIVEQRAELAEKDLAMAAMGEREERRKFWLAAALGTVAFVLLSGLLALQVQRRKARAARDAAIIAEREAGLSAMLQATDAERKRLASELHDGVGQRITGLKYRLEHLAHSGAVPDTEELGALQALAEDAGRDVRGIAHSMMPRTLEQLGLAPAVAELVQRMFARTNVEPTFDHFGVDRRYPPETETGLFRIAQELLGNVARHAAATKLSAQLLQNKGHLVLIVEDDGRGFDPAAAAGGIGMRNIHDRVRVLAGRVDVVSAIGEGTTVTVRVPIVP